MLLLTLGLVSGFFIGMDFQQCWTPSRLFSLREIEKSSGKKLPTYSELLEMQKIQKTGELEKNKSFPKIRKTSGRPVFY